MKYRNYLFSGSPESLAILSAFLFEDGFEGVQELGHQLEAYVAYDHPNRSMTPLTKNIIKQHKISFTERTVEDTNWNAAWESSFAPIRVGDDCYIRATHHKALPDIKYDIVIQPKMSFGTGHHPTTHLMVEEMLRHDLSDQSVFDYGTGTGILAILAEKMKAAHITAIDIDPNSIDNVQENILLNQCDRVMFELGDIDLVKGKTFSTILANITRNTLLDNWMSLNDALGKNGVLMISGFYSEDAHYFENKAEETQLTVVTKKSMDGWMMMAFKK